MAEAEVGFCIIANALIYFGIGKPDEQVLRIGEMLISVTCS